MRDTAELDEDSLICAACTEADTFLVDRLEGEGATDTCSQCGKKTIVFPLWAISDAVHNIFKTYARQAEEEPDFSDDHVSMVPGGRSPLETLQEELGFPFEVAEALLKDLGNRYPRDQHHDPGDDWYDETGESFVLGPTESDSAMHAWDVFVQQVRHHGRFFNDAAREYLDELFGPLLRGELHDGIPPLVQLGASNSKVRKIYRGRIANTRTQQAAIFANPRRELSPPPQKLRRANRMNAEGVGAFYGALDIETCVAELRPIVHGIVIVGQFTFSQPVKVLDMRLVDRAVPSLSWFDVDFPEKYAAGEFMRSLHDIMRVPVFSDADSLEYLPTQVIAEYLESKGVQGVLYTSSLVDRPNPMYNEVGIRLREVCDEGINLVLFSRSSIVMGRNDEHQYKIIDVGFPPDLDSMINTQHVERAVVNAIESEDLEYPLVDDALEPTLEFVDGNLTVCSVKGIKYTLAQGKVSFYERADLSQPEDFGF